MSGRLFHLPFSRSLFCLPIGFNPEECIAYFVREATLLSHELEPGMFAIAHQLSPFETLAAGELVIASIGTLFVLKRILLNHRGHILLADDSSMLGPFKPLEIKIEARVIHACSGRPETCSGWKQTLEWQEGLQRIAS